MEQELKLLGLNDLDIKVYLALLKLGESLASEVAKEAEVPRASIYDVLERLEQEGLASYIVKDFKKYFSAADPKTIIKNLEYKKKRMQDILPKLEELKHASAPETTKTEVYEGAKGLQTIINMVLEEKELFVVGAARKSPEVLPFFIEKWHKERTKRKIKVKIIYHDTKEIRDSLKKKQIRKMIGVGNFWDSRFLETKYSVPIMTIVFGNKTALITWKKETPSAILIKSHDVAETYKQYILGLWKIAKK